jgi:hypothetical protein
MKELRDKREFLEILDKLSEFLDKPQEQVIIDKFNNKGEPDIIASIGEYTFIIEYKATAARAPLLLAKFDLLHFKIFGEKNAIPLIVVPFMGEQGKAFLKDSGISWFDLSGNAHIKAKNLLIHVEGKPNQFKKSGRPSNAFADKSSRVARFFLVNPHKEITQSKLAKSIGVGEGFVSRIIRRLEGNHLIVRNKDGSLKAADPNQLLESWHEVYDFSRHSIIKGHVAARSGEDLLNNISTIFNNENIDYAATGLGAAWLLNHFATFRVVTFFLRYHPSDTLLNKLKFRKDERGANIWFVVPNDEGVFYGEKEYKRINCVHPVQIYMDLKGHPERASEAAAMLRNEYLNWSNNER